MFVFMKYMIFFYFAQQHTPHVTKTFDELKQQPHRIKRNKTYDAIKSNHSHLHLRNLTGNRTSGGYGMLSEDE